MTATLQAPPQPTRPRKRDLAGRLRKPLWTPRPQRPLTQGERTLSTIATTATMCALVATWMVVQLLFLGGLAEQRAQQQLYGEFRTSLAGATAPTGPVTPLGTPVALLSIPHLGLQQVVTEGTASGDLLTGVGHLRNTVLPGQLGTAVLMGRARTYGGPFGRLAELSAGDEITVVTGQGKKRFTVLGVRRTGDPLPQPRPAEAARLVLVSAEGTGRFGALSPGEAIYVDAEAKKAWPTPAGLPTSVPDPEKPMGTETTVLPLLALCLGLLLALTCAVIAALDRFSTALVWVIATPMALALAWMTTDVVMRMLPNLM